MTETCVDYILTNTSIDNKDKLMTNEGMQKMQRDLIQPKCYSINLNVKNTLYFE